MFHRCGLAVAITRGSPPPMRVAGTVCEQSRLKAKGFGFIKPKDGGANIFCHVNMDANETAKNLTKGQAVTYVVGQNGRGPCAIFIETEAEEASCDMSTETVGGRGRETEGESADQELPDLGVWLQELESHGLLFGIYSQTSSLYIVRLIQLSKYPRALTFENLCQASATPRRQPEAGSSWGNFELQRPSLEAHLHPL